MPECDKEGFGRTSETDGNVGDAESGGGESLHGAGGPPSEREFGGAAGVGMQWAEDGETHLAAVGVSAEVEVDTGDEGFRNNFRGVGKEDAENVIGFSGPGIFDAGGAELVGIVHAADP